MFPKHTQLQNKTLATQVQIPMLSCKTILSVQTPSLETLGNVTRAGCMAGDGIMLGLISSKAKVPAIPTTAERINPGLDLSTRYHNTGFTRARVKETCRVDCQGNFLIAKAIPTKAPMLRTTGVQSALWLGRSLYMSLSTEDEERCLRTGPPGRFVESSPSDHMRSTHGCKLPRATQANPQNIKCFHEYRSNASALTGASFWLSWRCVMSVPYATPITKRSIPLSRRGKYRPRNPVFRRSKGARGDGLSQLTTDDAGRWPSILCL